ncbi:hypothetical protein RIF29_25516 [Crotalaria pallida]|uniref:Uncharacterized protein n=1 Tax=Crotalaria pallida TaxID=3830 RepID=A0AAN9I4A9_CROPI
MIDIYFVHDSMDPEPIAVAIPEIVDDEEVYDSFEDSLYKPDPREDNDEDDTNSKGGAEEAMEAATKHGTGATAETATEVATAKKRRVKTTPLKGPEGRVSQFSSDVPPPPQPTFVPPPPPPTFMPPPPQSTFVPHTQSRYRPPPIRPPIRPAELRPPTSAGVMQPEAMLFIPTPTLRSIAPVKK